jgi:phosphate transport system substrate-binding protein
LIDKQPTDANATAAALKFFDWSYRKGIKAAESLDYIPMPDKVVNDVETYWKKEIKDSSGKPLYAMAN